MDGKELQRIRRYYIGNQKQFADYVGVRRVTVSDWERGAAPVPRMAAILARLWEKYPDLVRIVAEDEKLMS